MGNKWNFYFLVALHENLGDGHRKQLPDQNILSRTLFMVSNERYLLWAVFWKPSSSFCNLFRQCRQCKLKTKVKRWKKNNFFPLFYVYGEIFPSKPDFFSVICKYRSKETKMRKFHFSNLIYNQNVRKIRKRAKVF